MDYEAAGPHPIMLDFVELIYNDVFLGIYPWISYSMAPKQRTPMKRDLISVGITPSIDDIR